MDKSSTNNALPVVMMVTTSVDILNNVTLASATILGSLPLESRISGSSRASSWSFGSLISVPLATRKTTITDEDHAAR